MIYCNSKKISVSVLKLTGCFFFSVECVKCDEYTRHVQSIVPGVVAFIALFCVMVFFESIFVCKKKGKVTQLGLVCTATYAQAQV